MISSVIDMILLAALAATSGSVLMMYRRLQRFDALQGQAAREFARSSDALDRAREALVRLHADGGEVTVTLATRLNEARMLMNDIEQSVNRATAAFAATEAATAAHRVAASRAGPRPTEAPVEAPAARRGPRPAADTSPATSAAARTAAAPSAAAPSAAAPEAPRAAAPAADAVGHSATVPVGVDAHAVAAGPEPERAASGDGVATHPARPEDPAALGIGKPSAVERIRAAARAGQRRPAGTEGGEVAVSPAPAERIAMAEDGEPARSATGVAAASGPALVAERWTPPRTMRSWSEAAFEVAAATVQWGSPSGVEGIFQPALSATAVDWREMARHAAQPS